MEPELQQSKSKKRDVEIAEISDDSGEGFEVSEEAEVMLLSVSRDLFVELTNAWLEKFGPSLAKATIGESLVKSARDSLPKPTKQKILPQKKGLRDDRPLNLR